MLSASRFLQIIRMEDAGSQGLDATAFLAASGAVEVLFAAAVVRGICAHRRMLCAEAVRAFKKFLNTVGNDRFLTLAERNAMHEKLTQLRLRMARTYARVLAAMCLVFVLSIQRNLILGGLRWMTAPFAWLVLGIFALLVVIQLHPSILSAATLNFWYVVGTTVVAIGYWPAFLPAEHLSTVSVVALVLYRLPSAMVAPQLALIVVGNLTLPCVVFARTIIEAYEFNRRGLGVSFTIHVEVTCSLMAITVSVILRSALRHIAEQYVRSTKAATELNAASVSCLQGERERLRREAEKERERVTKKESLLRAPVPLEEPKGHTLPALAHPFPPVRPKRWDSA